MFERITILGPGLLGASLAMAAKKRGLAHEVVVWSRRDETRAACHGRDWCDRVADSPENAVPGAALVVVCTPVDAIAPLVRSVKPALAEGALVTDVGSTKGRVCADCRRILADAPARFVGAHPMAGSERTGMRHARADLFEGAACFVTPVGEDDAEPARLLGEFWQALGMRVVTLDPERHDQVVAHISHLPHLLASALCDFLAAGETDWPSYAGNGLRDTTRVAAGDPVLWSQIFSQNAGELVTALERFETTLGDLKNALAAGDEPRVRAALERAKAYRDGFTPAV